MTRLADTGVHFGGREPAEALMGPAFVVEDDKVGTQARPLPPGPHDPEVLADRRLEGPEQPLDSPVGTGCRLHSIRTEPRNAFA